MPAPQAGQSQSWSGIPLNAITGGFTVTPSPTCPITSPFGTPGEPPPAQPGRLLQCTGTVTTLSGSNFLSASTPQFYWILPGTYLVAYHVTLSDGTLHRGSGGSTYTRKARATREAPQRGLSQG